MSWDLKFPEPIAVPSGDALATLRDAATFIDALSIETRDELRWQNAVLNLTHAAFHQGSVDLAHLAVINALHPKPEQIYDADRSPRGHFRSTDSDE